MIIPERADYYRGMGRKEIGISNFHEHETMPGSPIGKRTGHHFMHPSQYIRNTWQLIGRGMKYIMYFRWTILDSKFERGYFLKKKDGMYASPHLLALEENNLFLSKYGHLFYEAEVPKRKIAILDPQLSYLQTFWENNSPDLKFCSHPAQPDVFRENIGMHRLLTKMNYVTDFIPEEYIREGVLREYKVLILAGTWYLSSDVVKIIEKWLKEGGFLIAVGDKTGKFDEFGNEVNVMEKFSKIGDNRVLWVRKGYPTQLGYGWSPKFSSGGVTREKRILDFLSSVVGIEKEVSFEPAGIEESIDVEILEHPEYRLYILINRQKDIKVGLPMFKVRIKAEKNYKNIFVVSP